MTKAPRAVWKYCKGSPPIIVVGEEEVSLQSRGEKVSMSSE
jgi:hypothetical protein